MSHRKTHSPASHSIAGFTYIGLLILIAVMGVMLATIGTFWHTTQQRAREKQLLFVGNQFSRAITAYYLNSPGGAHQFPKKLEDLVQDKRFPTTTRYLRKIFADPFTSSTNWGLIKGADGGITGVYSLSDIAPIKQDNFPKGNEALVGKKHVSEWLFSYNVNANSQQFASAAAQGSGSAAGTNTAANAQGSSGTTIANNIPPAYRVPSPDPLPPDPTADQRKLHMCQTMFVQDASICARLAVKLGDADGAICMASANERFSLCSSTDLVMLPPLIVQYK